MANAKLRRLLASIASTAVLAGSGVTQAGNYMGSFDPPFDFVGSYNISIDDSCVFPLLDGSGNGWISSSLCSMQMIFPFVSGTVNIASPSYSGVVTWDNWATGDILGVRYIGFDFAAPDTLLVLNTGESPDAGIPFYIQFTSDSCGLGGVCGTPANVVADAGYNLGFPICTNCDLNLDAVPFQVGNPPGTVFLVNGSIPEPGTLALLAAALGGGWLARRRKTSAV